jgi:hypothetical protein
VGQEETEPSDVPLQSAWGLPLYQWLQVVSIAAVHHSLTEKDIHFSMKAYGFNDVKNFCVNHEHNFFIVGHIMLGYFLFKYINRIVNLI